MKDHKRDGLGFVLGSAVAVLGVGCSASGTEADIAEKAEEIRNGTIVSPWAVGSTEPAWARAVVRVPGCTGTVIQPSWVLTARHCNTWVGATITSERPTGNVTRTVDAVVRNPDPAAEAMLLHLSSAFTDIPAVTLTSRTTAQLVGNNALVYGYGAKANGGSCTSNAQCSAGEYCQTNWGVCFTPSAELRKATLSTAAYNSDPTLFAMPQNASSQTILPGDSGGPAGILGEIAGVAWFASLSERYESSVAAQREFVAAPSRQQYTVGDYNGDGKKDVIITNASGSYWYYSTGTGTWNPAYTRTDLPLGSVKYTPGDFNGDGKTDVIITTTSGSYWYYSTGTGTWNTSAYTRTDLLLDQVDYVVADFNADGREDTIIQNSSGSYWYYSTSTLGSFNNAYTRTDLPAGKARYVPGDFNGDGKKDVIISTTSGSYWYYSTGTGTWNSAAYNRTDLPLQVAEYTPGDFNGDGKTDVIISTATGSYWYYSTGTGTWNSAAYNRTDLPLGSVVYKAADFNGDGKSDVIISNSSGSYWYYSTGTGTWNAAYTRTDLPWHANAYAPGDFNGDGKSDVIISNVSGSYWYYSTGTGTWNAAYTRTDLPM